MAGKFLFSFLMVFSSLVNAQWYRQEVPPGIDYLTAVHFIDATTGWVTGNNGAILKTTNGGRSWERLTGTSDTTYSSIFFTDTRNGFVTGYPRNGYGVVRRTSDSGATWRNVRQGIMFPLKEVVFTTRDTGWVIGGPVSRLSMGAIDKTTDGGNTWQEQQFPRDAVFSSIDMISSQIGWVAGSDGTILSTTDGGTNWNLKRAGNGEYIRSVDFISSTHGWIAGRGGILEKTTNGGDAWISQSPGRNFWFETILFTDRGTGWAGGYDTLTKKAFILTTTDGGDSWYSQTINDRLVTSITDIFSLDGMTVWATGDGGTLLVTTNGGDIYQEPSSQAGYVLLQQNTPNPFSTVTIIKYALPPALRDERVHVKLAIYDLTGNEVTVLVNEEKNYGTYEVRWNASGLPSGIYLCHLHAGGFAASKKMVVVR